MLAPEWRPVDVDGPVGTDQDSVNKGILLQQVGKFFQHGILNLLGGKKKDKAIPDPTVIQ